MKARVIVPVFKDLERDTYHEQGTIIEVTKQRFEEILKAGKFIEAVHGRAPATETKDDSDKSEEAPADEPEPDPAPSSILETDSGMSFEPTERKPGH